jgi:hypothetical protein
LVNNVNTKLENMNYLLKSNKNTIMQKTQTTNEPTPQNISKWSLGRKEILAKNQFLMNQLDSKKTMISELKSEIKELKIKVKLNGLEFPSSLSDSKRIYFDYQFMDNDGEYLTYKVSNDELSYENEVEVPISEIIEHFDDSEITQDELESYISEYLTDSISY